MPGEWTAPYDGGAMSRRFSFPLRIYVGGSGAAAPSHGAVENICLSSECGRRWVEKNASESSPLFCDRLIHGDSVMIKKWKIDTAMYSGCVGWGTYQQSHAPVSERLVLCRPVLTSFCVF